eukprot:TRINITY_DN2841_c0_g1_i1.p1 TRINITY_DN2841_c0_g1~~TRINITY_DN2841_c0_g1_i1.p1  ORF type:complete len:441 (-),score=98.97 TRINITY_DN2841_c0_g1_i1:40-1362(-)
MQVWEIILSLTVQLALSLFGIVLLFGWFLRYSTVFPLNTRNPFLTSLTIISLIIYCLIFDFTALTATTAPCIMQQLVNLMALLFYNAIFLRLFSLWFQAKLTHQKFKGETNGWFVRNRKFVSNSYSIGYLAMHVLLFWVPALILAKDVTERQVDPATAELSYATFTIRCSFAAGDLASRIVYTSCTIAWVLQAILLWKVRGIEESLSMKKEILISCVNNLLCGVLAIAFTYGNLWRGMVYLGIVLVFVEIYAAMIIPLRMAGDVKLISRQHQQHGSTLVASGSRSSITAEIDFVDVILHSLGDSQELYQEFKQSLVKEFAVENLLFLEEVSSLNRCAKPAPESIRVVVEKFLVSGADYEVNCNVDVRNELVEKLRGVEDPKEIAGAMEMLNKIAKGSMQDLRHGALLRFKRKVNVPNSSREPTSVEVQQIPNAFPAEFVS